ncbi:MAG: response regulator transcription factor [Deltaproteobacteria bacterium]|nr:response regulator transcription factor [Deltaproteobacteria bacterium]
MRRILLIEDSAGIYPIVAAALGKNYSVANVETLADAWTQVNENSFDLILLDVGLPDGDGFKFFARLRSTSATEAVPVIFLTAKAELADRILGFSLGAEDYIAKPFEPLELRARVDARLRSAHESAERAGSFRKENLRFDVLSQKVFISENSVEHQVDLTPAEFKLLHFFARHEDQVFSRDQLLSSVWHNEIHVHDRTVDVHVSNLRKKLESAAFTIKAVYGSGYRFEKKTCVSRAA